MDDGRSLPVFVFPTALTFYADDSSSQRQVLTIYNPYDFSIRFSGEFSVSEFVMPTYSSVLSTCPRKYNVVDPIGTIRPRYAVDMYVLGLVAGTATNDNRCRVVRINDVSRGHHNKTDQFRIRMQRSGDQNPCGSRDVSATLYATKKSSQTSASGEMNNSMFSMTQSAESNDDGAPREHRINDNQPPDLRIRHQNPNLLITLIALSCVLILMMPVASEGIVDAEARSLLPSYLHIALPHKLIAAYVLGLVTMVIFRT